MSVQIFIGFLYCFTIYTNLLWLAKSTMVYSSLLWSVAIYQSPKAHHSRQETFTATASHGHYQPMVLELELVLVLHNHC